MNKLDVYINNFFRKFYNRRNRKKLKNKEITIISSNCTGAFILHDLGLKFNSPFVNLWLYPKDFIKYLSNMDFYNNSKLEFIKKDNIEYPVAKLEDIEIYFQHYKTIEEAEKKWYERKDRINKNNLFVIMTDRDGCTYKDLKEFDSLPFENKICFTHKNYEELNSTFYIEEFKKLEEVGMMFEYKKRFSPKKYFDNFDYIEWFNKKSDII